MSDEPTRSSAGRRYAIMAAKIAVSLLLLYFLFSRVDVGELWADARQASVLGLAIALFIYTLNMVASAWRWHILLEAQRVHVPRLRLFGSLLVAAFFNNFLPSNIGGDVIRIRDTAGPAQSKTLATTVVLVDRGLGLLALVLVAAIGATTAANLHGAEASPVWPSWLWAVFIIGAAITGPAMYSPAGVGRLLQPLTFLHPEWIGEKIDTQPKKMPDTKVPDTKVPDKAPPKTPQEVRIETPANPFTPNAIQVSPTAPSIEVVPVPTPRVEGDRRDPF